MQRFWDKVQVGPGCWEWTASRRGAGYGRFQMGGKGHAAHRISWEMANGPIPSGMFVCHRCDNPSCVRPDHLFLGTPSDNTRDAYAKGRQTNPRPQADMVECLRGHEFTEDNTYTAPDGKRRCRECRRQYGNGWARKKRAAA